jgi:predicted dehydrogenase
VLCEKPFASDAAEAQTMVDAFAARGVMLAEAFMYRFHPQTVKVLEMVKSGAVGDLRVIDSSFTFLINDEANVRLSKPLAGGGLMDVGCYCINLMRLVTGEEPIEAKAIANFGAVSGVDESLVGVLRFPSGVVAHLDCGLRAYKIHSYEIRGTTGRIVVEDSFPIEAYADGVIHWWHDNQHETITIPPINHYTLMTEDFADALLNNRPPRYLAQDGVLNMRAIDMLYASAGN